MTIPPFSPYMRDGVKYSENPWSPEHPDRVMNISCAENIYMWDKFKARYPKFTQLHDADNMYAISCSGRKYLRHALADFMTKEVCKPIMRLLFSVDRVLLWMCLVLLSLMLVMPIL